MNEITEAPRDKAVLVGLASPRLSAKETADEQSLEELEDLVGAEALKCDLFKYPHHGKQALKESFFQAMDASLAVVTNHQKIEKASSYLGYKHFPTIYTNVKGVYTHLATDGRRWLCEYVPIR